VIKSSHRRGSRKTDVDTDESDSDPDQLTSSRTESSNQLDAGKVKHSESLMLPIVSIRNILLSCTAIYITYNVLVSTSQRTQCAYIKNTSWWTVCKAITAIYCRNYMELIKTLCSECRVKLGYTYSNHWAVKA